MKAARLALFALVLGIGAPLAAQTQANGRQGRAPLPAAADEAMPLDGLWVVLSETMSAGDFFTGSWTWTSPVPVTFSVTDVYVVSDAFAIYDFGVLVASTPLVPDWPAYAPDPFSPPWESDPDAAFASPAFSSAVITFSAGAHSITIQDVHLPPTPEGGSFPDGSVAFKAEPCAAVVATEVVRLGVPPNPSALFPGVTSAPIVGAVWDPVLAPFTPLPVIDALVVSLGAPINLPIAGLGTLLCTLSPPAFFVISSPGTPFAVPIPLKCSLIGLPFIAQAAEHDQSGATTLTNALDCVVGSL